VKKRYSLKGRTNFQRIYKDGRGYRANGFTIIYISEKSNDIPKFGFSFDKKFGCAVERNKAKRVLRSIIVKLLPNIKNGAKIVFRFNESFKMLNYAKIEEVVKVSLKNLKLFCEQVRE
jgi:ribonuclease P protein component